jgi:adenine-specific DNA methylase
LRGSTGKRNYFSRSNALVLDGVLRTIRDWWRRDLLTRHELFSLMASVLEEIVITANVSGTFHDFNRDRLWPNALQPFFLRVPLIRSNSQHVEITHDDALNAAGYVSRHDVCYIDPPYNFRQYSAYYHFLNFVAAIPVIEDLKGYLAGIAQVRGQNPNDDQSSDFCSKNSFIESLRSLIARVPSDHIVLSYYNGRNHWNHWANVDEPTREGLEKLSALFADKALFEDFEVVPALNVRRNYQSRVGERKSMINEYLFMGRKSSRSEALTGAFVPLEANVRWGLTGDFSHTLSVSEELAQNRRLESVA